MRAAIRGGNIAAMGCKVLENTIVARMHGDKERIWLRFGPIICERISLNIFVRTQERIALLLSESPCGFQISGA
jgi:hypothetical protein